MLYDEELVAGKLRRWERYLDHYRLPTWEDIPAFGLYMEQVIALLKQYLNYLPPELKDEQVITASTINNYVRMKIMPEPQKKKYYRIHIAYLIMIFTLKQSLSIAMLQKLIPMGITEEKVKKIYNAYVERHRASALYFIDQVRVAAAKIVGREPHEELSVDNTVDLISATAIVGGFARLLAEKLLLLEGHKLEDGDDISIVEPR